MVNRKLGASMCDLIIPYEYLTLVCKMKVKDFV